MTRIRFGRLRRSKSHGRWAHARAVYAAVAAAAVLVPGASALAQALPAIPPGVQNPVPQGSPIPRVLPRPAPNVTPGALLPPQQEPAEIVPSRPVRVVAVTVSGVTAYPLSEIEAFTANLVGPSTPLDKVDAARQAILGRYRSDGYILTTVSAALDAQGRLRFQVIEGHIASVKLDQDIGPAGVQVLRFLERLTEERPISASTLERYLLLAQDVPGVTVHATLQPSNDEPGALTLVASVSRRAVSGLVVADNRAFRLTGPVQAIGVVDFNSFTEYGERTELSIYHAFPNSQTFGQASTEMFLGSSGLRVRVYAGAGPSNPTGQLAELGYEGFTTVFGGQVSYPVIRSRQQNLSVFGTFDGLESTIDTYSGGSNGSRGLTSQDSLRIFRAGAEYSLSDLLLSSDLPAINTVTGRISQGVSILGASRAGDSNLPRAGEEPQFFKFNFELTRTQTLFYPWEGASVALMGLLAGQVTPDILPPEEQFFLGGLRYTRGFYSGQVIGDNALAATAELQLNTPLPVERIGIPWPVNAQFYGFYDWGETWQNQKSDANARLASVGGGVRLAVTEAAEVDFEGVGRLTRYPYGNNPGTPGLYGGAFYWRVLLRF